MKTILGEEDIMAWLTRFHGRLMTCTINAMDQTFQTISSSGSTVMSISAFSSQYQQAHAVNETFQVGPFSGSPLLQGACMSGSASSAERTNVIMRGIGLSRVVRHTKEADNMYTMAVGRTNGIAPLLTLCYRLARCTGYQPARWHQNGQIGVAFSRSLRTRVSRFNGNFVSGACGKPTVWRADQTSHARRWLGLP